MIYKVLTPFTVKTKQGDLTLNPGQVITLAEEKAKKLIEDEKIKIDEKYENYFKDAVGRINQNYPSCVLDYVRQKHPERFQESLQLENRLNDLWGKDFKEFQKAVDAWRDINLELVKLFKKQS